MNDEIKKRYIRFSLNINTVFLKMLETYPTSDTNFSQKQIPRG